MLWSQFVLVPNKVSTPPSGHNKANYHHDHHESETEKPQCFSKEYEGSFLPRQVPQIRTNQDDQYPKLKHAFQVQQCNITLFDDKMGIQKPQTCFYKYETEMDIAAEPLRVHVLRYTRPAVLRLKLHFETPT